jgi:hypothetical protein
MLVYVNPMIDYVNPRLVYVNPMIDYVNPRLFYVNLIIDSFPDLGKVDLNGGFI